MKKQIYVLLTVLTAAFAFTACTDQDYEELDKGNDVLTLSVSQAVDTLNESNHANDAVALSWTTGTNEGTGERIYYSLDLAPEGASFAGAYTAVDSMTQVYTWSINQENLNTLVLDKFGGHVGQPMTLEARVTAHVEGISTLQQAVQRFTVTPYEPVTTTLYILGDATPSGWNADNAAAMTRTDNGIFTWEGNLNAGNFKFITTRGQFVPSYNKGANDDKVVLRKTFDDPDEQWTIAEPHYYKVTVNLLAGTISYAQADGAQPLYDQLFFVGDPTGWNFEAMTRDALDPFLFRYGAVLGQGGEFKFGTASGSWENMYKATTQHAAYTDTNVSFVSGFDPDNKWYLNDGEAGKAYKICVDIRQGSERMMMKAFTPYPMIYLVGDATPAGWSLDNATPMTATAGNPYVFTWTGTLNAGELKFTCDRQSDWNGAWFLCAAGNDVAPAGKEEHMLFVDKSDNDFKAQYVDTNIGDVDQKWKITSSGTYTITLNQLTETVSIVKQ